METQWSYDVFLSFRGVDTRKTFVDHLYNSLSNAGFHTFREDVEFMKVPPIGLEIERAIEESHVAVIVFSKNYAASSWCLDELLYILERSRFSDCYRVFPTFYDIHPAEVGNQKGGFEEAFEEFEKNGEYSKDKIERWRSALKEASKLAGIMLQDEDCNGMSFGVECNLEELCWKIGLHRYKFVASFGAFRRIEVERRTKEEEWDNFCLISFITKELRNDIID